MVCKDQCSNIFPPYYKVLEAKKQCYPVNIGVNEYSATVPLQSLLDHTAERLLLGKSEGEIRELNENLLLVSKWGCDGSSGHSEYKQIFSEKEKTDANMFLTSLVPLKLHESNNNNKLIWINPRPSSTKLCRPIKFEFIKETSENTKKEVNRVESEIKNLNNTVIKLYNKEVSIQHILIFSMVDGKIAQTITETSSMAVCCICQAKPSEMNDLQKCANKVKNEDAYRFGLHPLHARIKFMECILHIAYNKNFQSWRTSKHTKNDHETEKKRIQTEFNERLGLKVDCVKQGMGTTNDGNTSRRFVSNPELTSHITGVDENLIRRFSVILTTLNSNKAIDAEKFGTYCYQTAELFVSLYGWYYMPNTVHKILIHGKEIISAAMLPIGFLSEEAQEARNKDYRKYRLDHSRKCSRISTNEDVFHMLCTSSDPYIYGHRNDPKLKVLDLPEEVKFLLKE